ncbi:MAG: imelysin family protein [Myxococcota bacterium]|nr:imelysin family protein [Myxococcota bacterium]
MNVEKPTRFSSWHVLSAIALGTFAIEIGCAVDKDSTNTEPVYANEPEVRDALTGMLADAWPFAIDPSLTRAEVAAAALKDATAAWSATGGSEDTRLAAQDAWVDAMTAWQELEVMQVGPAASALKAEAGEGIRDDIYSWPTVNACRIDQITSRKEYEEEDFFDDAIINSYGLDGLETVLFSEPNENSCSSNSGINREGTWNALGADGIAAARAELGDLLAQRVVDDLERIRDGWEGGFADELASAGAGSTVFDTSVKGVNAIYDGLFYLETFVKDRKLGWPLGLRACGEEDCTDKVESVMADKSNEWLAANLAGFRTLYSGGELDGEQGIGMYDLLVSVQEEALADDVLVKLEAADAAVGNLTGPVNDALSTDPDAVTAAHEAVRVLTELLKVDIATVLALEIPAEAAGDND